MAYTEVSHQGYFSRIANSFKSVLIGIVLFCASIVLLFWNEYRSVIDIKTMQEAGGAVVAAQIDSIDSGLEGKLVHLTGKATTDEVLTDSEFGVEASALRLNRTVEMYQWEEKRESKKQKQVGGSTKTVTRYTYHKTWSDKPIDSSDFKEGGHANPGSMPYSSTSMNASPVEFGAYQLSSGLLSQITKSEPLPLPASLMESLPQDLRTRSKKQGQRLFVGKSPSQPEVGDLRIGWSVVKPQTVSIMAQQSGTTFSPFQTSAGGKVELLEYGTVSADEMVQREQSRNAALTWGLRLLGFILNAVGIALVFSPLTTLADVIPFLGNLLGSGVAIFAMVIGAMVSLVTIAIAWIVFRPLLGIALILLAVGIVVGGTKLFGKKSVSAG